MRDLPIVHTTRGDSGTHLRGTESRSEVLRRADAAVRSVFCAPNRIKEACDALDRLVDIDPYDYRNQERISKLEGKVDPAFLQNILARAAKAATVSTRTDGFSGAGSGESAPPASEESRAQQALEDLIVQVEIFLQYSLQSKAIERLERLAQLFPGEEERNERLRALYERANWWPKGAAPKPFPKRRRRCDRRAAPASAEAALPAPSFRRRKRRIAILPPSRRSIA